LRHEDCLPASCSVSHRLRVVDHAKRGPTKSVGHRHQQHRYLDQDHLRQRGFQKEHASRNVITSDIPSQASSIASIFTTTPCCPSVFCWPYSQVMSLSSRPRLSAIASAIGLRLNGRLSCESISRLRRTTRLTRYATRASPFSSSGFCPSPP